MLSGALGLLIGRDVASRWSLYLLLSLLPISVYLPARAFGAGRPAAAASAAMAPFLMSAAGVGYEQQAYLWTGFVVWTQACPRPGRGLAGGRGARAGLAQLRADGTRGADVDRLISVIEHDGGGRAYAGMPSNWGQDFTVGAVPVFRYLESRDVDEVGYTLRTASLMTGPEYCFDEHGPSDYRLFGIRYLILPAGRQPPVPARLAMRSGPYWLWTIDGAGYVQAGQIVGEISANRTNVGTRSVRLLGSGLAAGGACLGVRYGSSGGAPSHLPKAPTPPPAGQVSAQSAGLTAGAAAATVQLRRPGVVVLSASYDPGWTATVNGHPQPTRMVAPALVAVDVPAGTDHVVFRFHGYGDHPALIGLSGLTLALLAVGPRRLRAPSGS